MARGDRTRLTQLHKDARARADPSHVNRSNRIGRKIKKSAWSIADHKKAKTAAGGGIIVGNVILGIATAGASVVIQGIVAGAAHAANASGSRAVKHQAYKKRRNQLDDMDTDLHEYALKDPRKDIRTFSNVLEYNEDHFIDALIEARANLERFKTRTAMRAHTVTKNGAVKSLKQAYKFYFEYQAVLHYFQRYEEFARFYLKFAAGSQQYLQERINRVNKAAKRTVAKEAEWHKEACLWEGSAARQPNDKDQICYGPDDKHPSWAKNRMS